MITFVKAVLDHTEDIALNIRTFWFKPSQPVNHIAGQYGHWYLPHPNADERGERRWFTISASPTEAPLVSLTTKFTAPNGSSFKAALRSLKPGDSLDLTAPLGDFVLPQDASRQLVFVAGGIGVTPFRSIIKWLLDKREKRGIQLIYAANKLAEVAFRPLFAAYGLNPKLVLSEPPSGWQGETGRLNGTRILKLAGASTNKLFYLSGPEPMIEALAKSLQSAGLPKDQIVTDFFPGYREI